MSPTLVMLTFHIPQIKKNISNIDKIMFIFEIWTETDMNTEVIRGSGR